MEEQKKKRKISIFSILLWLMLIMIMTVIMVNGIVRQNALEDSSDILRIRIKAEELEGYDFDEEYRNLKFEVVKIVRWRSFICYFSFC